MKKYYLFAALATAGLFAGCSSDDTLSLTEGNFAPINDNEKAAISLLVGKPTSNTTRGTGTVGSTTDDELNNQWAGQTFKVSMFQKGTIDYALSDTGTPDSYVFKDTEFTAPNGALGAGNLAQVEASAGAVTEKVSYFPSTGAFDFWAYRLDDAVTNGDPQPSEDNTKMEVEFTIDGSQDIMVAKAKPNVEGSVEEGWQGSDGIIPDNRIFSAYSARREVKPKLVFDHLLTRLRFTVKASKNLSIVTSNEDGEPTEDEILKDSANAIKITKISVKSLDKGKLITAYNAETEVNLNERIVWTQVDPEEMVSFSLMQRDKQVEKKAVCVWSESLNSSNASMTTTLEGLDITLNDINNTHKEGIWVYGSKDFSEKDGLPTGKRYATVQEFVKDGTKESNIFYVVKIMSAPVYGKTADASAKLVELDPVRPVFVEIEEVDKKYATPVGEALLVAPTDGETGYKLYVEMQQRVVTEKIHHLEWSLVDGDKTYYFASEEAKNEANEDFDNWKNTAEPKTDYLETPFVEEVFEYVPSTKELTILGVSASTPENPDAHADFLPGYDYVVNITLTGLENIEMDAEATTPGGFNKGGSVDVTDEDEWD